MPPLPLGQDVLRAMLAQSRRVLLVNSTTETDDVRIVAVAIVGHNASDSSRQTLHSMDLAADESEWFQSTSPSAEPPTLLEVLLRVSLRGRVVDVYQSATAPAIPPARGWEAGVRPLTGPLRPSDVPIPEAPGFVAYLLPFE